MGFLDPKVWIAIALAALVGFASGFWKGGEGPRADLAAYKAAAAATAQAKEKEHERIEQEAGADAARARAQARDALAAAERAEAERSAAMVRLGGVVRDLADARRVLAAGRGGSTASVNPPASLRGDPADSGADLAGRLAACQADLTVLTDAMSVNAANHEKALIARDACVKQYDDVRALYNEE